MQVWVFNHDNYHQLAMPKYGGTQYELLNFNILDMETDFLVVEFEAKIEVEVCAFYMIKLCLICGLYTGKMCANALHVTFLMSLKAFLLKWKYIFTCNTTEKFL